MKQGTNHLRDFVGCRHALLRQLHLTLLVISLPHPFIMSVSVGPGATQFTRIPSRL